MTNPQPKNPKAVLLDLETSRLLRGFIRDGSSLARRGVISSHILSRLINDVDRRYILPPPTPHRFLQASKNRRWPFVAVPFLLMLAMEKNNA